MFRLRRGLQAGGLGRNRPPTTAAYIPLRHYAKPHKPVFLVPSRRPLPPPSVNDGIVVDVQSALRSPNISDRVRGVLRHMVHPVVILTTSTSPNPRDWRAITLSSFTSLSLDPHPLITFNVKTPSACATAMHARNRFIVHAMLPTTRAADFAARFSLPYVPGQDWKYAVRPNSVEQPLAYIHLGEKEQLLKDEDFTKEEIEEIEGLRKGKNPEVGLSGQFGRIPVLADESTDNLPALWEEVMFRLYCTPERTIPVQDHEIWVAKIERIEYPRHELGIYGIEPHAPLSLLYGDRSFRETGFHLISAHDKFRRWTRRKMEYEIGIREERKRKLLSRLERARRNKAAEKGYAYGELEMGNWAVKQLNRMEYGLVEKDSEGVPKSAAGELNEEGEPMEDEERETGEIIDIDKWMELSDKLRLRKRKILPTPGPDIIPSPPPPVSKLEPPSTPSKPKGIKLKEEDEPLEEEEVVVIEEEAEKAPLEEENGSPNQPPATSKPDVTSTNPTPESEPEPQSTPSNSDHSGKPKVSNLRKKLLGLTLQRQQPNLTPRHSITVYTSNPAGSSPQNFPPQNFPPQIPPSQHSPAQNAPPQNSPHQNSRPSAPISAPPQTQANTQELYLSDDPDAECGISSLEDYPKVSTEEKVKKQNKPLQSVRTSLESPSSSPFPSSPQYQKRQTQRLTPSFAPLNSTSSKAASSISSPQVIRSSFSSTSVALSEQEKYTLPSTSSSSSKDENASFPRKVLRYNSASFLRPTFRILRGSVLYSRFGIGKLEEPFPTTSIATPSQTPAIPAASTSTTSPHGQILETYKPPIRVVRKVQSGPSLDPSKETIYKPTFPPTPAPPAPLPKIPPPPPPEEGPATFFVYPQPPPLPPNSFPSGVPLNKRLRKLRKRHEQVNRIRFQHDPDILMDEDIVWDAPPPEDRGKGETARNGYWTENEAPRSRAMKFNRRKDSYDLQGWLRNVLRANVSQSQGQDQRGQWDWGRYREEEEEWVWEAPGKREAESDRKVQMTGGRKEEWLSDLNWRLLTERERKEQEELEKMWKRARGEINEEEEKKPAGKKEGRVKKPREDEVDVESEADKEGAEESKKESKKNKKKVEPPPSSPRKNQKLDGWQQKMVKKKRRQARTNLYERIGRV